jgi:hypothetical protein
MATPKKNSLNVPDYNVYVGGLEQGESNTALGTS